MRYPFAALIIACLLDVAAAQELPPANLVPVALSEQWTQVWRLYNLNPDCAAAGAIVAKVTKEGKGQVEFEEILGFSTYPQNSQKFRCNTHPTDGLSILYHLRRGSRALILLQSSLSMELAQVERQHSA